MDKNAIKKFATWARVELIEKVSQKAVQLGVTKKNPGNPMDQSVHGHLLSVQEQSQRAALIARVTAKGWQHTMEEVAYTWFNRFCALRYMEVNGYLPSHIRVFTDEEGAFKPQILTEAIHIELKGLDRDKVYQFKDKNQSEALYKYLLITQCNALSEVLPRMFQRIEDDTELLLPDNLLREGSVIEQMITLIPEEDWTDQVQIIGWLYQYYNTEPKDKVFANLKKNIKINKHDIPAATQLFTPDWIVCYMVENSLGRIWLERERALDDSTDEKAAAEGFGWKYYLPEAEQEPQVQVELKRQRQSRKDLKPADIRCVDPCMGSGHILVYMFDVLMQIYLDYGYSDREAVRSILEHNLYGLDIDDRAAQLAYFAIMMKARQYDKRLLTRTLFDGKPDIPQPQVYPIMESNSLNPDMVAYFVCKDAGLREDMETLMQELKDAKEYGSILTISPVDFEALYARFDAVVYEVHFQRDAVLHTLLPFVRQAQALAQQYEVVVTNPPYMGSGGMSLTLSDLLKIEYPRSKSDLFAVFIERCRDLTKTAGFTSLITMESWMYLSSYEELRQCVLREHLIVSLVHMPYLGKGGTSIGINFGTTVSVLKKRYIPNYQSVFSRISYYETDSEGVPNNFPVLNKHYSITSTDNFSYVSGKPIVYWASKTILNNFRTLQKINEVAIPASGTSTGDNDRFLRLWHEVDYNKICFIAAIGENKSEKWFPCNKGGSYRKWAGGSEYLIDWENDGYGIRNNRDPNGYLKSRPLNLDKHFVPGITWSKLGSGKISFRYFPAGFICESIGCALYQVNVGLYALLAFLNTEIASVLLSTINPSMGRQPGYIGAIPFSLPSEYSEKIERISNENITLSSADWNSFEISWDFVTHPIITESRTIKVIEGNREATTLHGAYVKWKDNCIVRFNQLKNNEEDLNRIFIDIYELNMDVSCFVDENDVSVCRIVDQPVGPDKSNCYVLSKKDAIITLISYAVGCMFGRYSLDTEGLAFAGGAWDDSKYNTFLPDRDGIVPITDEEYFTDDIIARFVDWLRFAFGGETLEENLRFIADALGGSGASRDAIRRYFLKDFYKDHLKTYKKRPIYWLFDSGKEDGFKALIYLHRYQPDTIARLRTDYVHELQSRYRTAVGSLENRIASATTAERVKLNKQLAKITAQAEELRLYEEKIHHLADQMIGIDLDDGVKHNYAIFQDVLAKI